MTEYVYTFDAFMAMATEPKNRVLGWGIVLSLKMKYFPGLAKMCTHTHTQHTTFHFQTTKHLKATTLRWQNISCLDPYFTSLGAHMA